MIRRLWLGPLLLISQIPLVTSAHAQKSLPAVRVGIAGISGSNAHPYVSDQLGLFAKNGIGMEQVVFQGGTQLVQAMVAGELPLGLIDGTPIFAADMRGANIVFIGGVINTLPYTIVSQSDIRAPNDLRGKRIGISRYGSSSDIAVRLTLERKNLKPDKEVAILQIGGQSERFAALKAGVVQATIVSPPFNLVARRLGFNDLIDISDTGIAYPHIQVAAAREFIDRHPDQVVRFLKGLFEGMSYWKDPAKKDPVTRTLAKFLKLDPEKERDQLDETFRYYGKVFPSRPYASLEGLEYSVALLKKTRPEAKNLQAKDYVVNRFVDELEKEGFLARLTGMR